MCACSHCCLHRREHTRDYTLADDPIKAKYESAYVYSLPCLQPYWVTEPRVMVSSSDIDRGGWGLFARVNIDIGTVICKYSGELVKLVGDSNGDWVAGVVEEDGSEVNGIDSEDPLNCAGRWMNHSIDPNAKLYVPLLGTYCPCIFRETLFVCLLDKNIREGEEITICYGENYWTGLLMVCVIKITLRDYRHLILCVKIKISIVSQHKFSF